MPGLFFQFLVMPFVLLLGPFQLIWATISALIADPEGFLGGFWQAVLGDIAILAGILGVGL